MYRCKSSSAKVLQTGCELFVVWRDYGNGECRRTADRRGGGGGGGGRPWGKCELKCVMVRSDSEVTAFGREMSVCVNLLSEAKELGVQSTWEKNTNKAHCWNYAKRGRQQCLEGILQVQLNPPQTPHSGHRVKPENSWWRVGEWQRFLYYTIRVNWIQLNICSFACWFDITDCNCECSANSQNLKQKNN